RADRTVIVGNNNTGQLKLSSLSDSLVFIPRLKHGGLQRRFSVTYNLTEGGGSFQLSVSLLTEELR
ncbi:MULTISPECIES: hypothetical protein, partial [unclassified Okeania]|uniref:hypothetical protein n=1 Tax=unclassified Okeania TaxID=2634635 RepID=UPI002580A1CA